LRQQKYLSGVTSLKNDRFGAAAIVPRFGSRQITALTDLEKPLKANLRGVRERMNELEDLQASWSLPPLIITSGAQS
jgi:hypothetical protein